jgi:hypothetical protein
MQEPSQSTKPTSTKSITLERAGNMLRSFAHSGVSLVAEFEEICDEVRHYLAVRALAVLVDHLLGLRTRALGPLRRGLETPTFRERVIYFSSWPNWRVMLKYRLHRLTGPISGVH